MSQIKIENQENKINQIEIKKKVFFFLHGDDFKEEDLEPLVLIDNERIHLVMIKKKYPYDMYYFFENKKYLKVWNDKKGNVLLYFNNWSGNLFISNPQKTEYIDRFTYTAGQNKLICDERKTINLEGFDVISLAINQFTAHEEAIFYILCYKLS